MSKLITRCPTCQHELKITVLHCPDCGLELRNEFELSTFDRLNSEQSDFLISFLRNRGNLKALQSDLDMSYPLAKRKLEELISALGIEDSEAITEEKEVVMNNLTADRSSTKASEIIKAKLIDAGGRTMVRLKRGELREISAAPNGKDFLCPQLIPYPYEIFDEIVKLLLRSPGYRAKKGNARNYRLGEPGCDENTAAGTVLLFMGKKPGESGLDPMFIFAAVLEWAGIAHNGRGEIYLTEEYKSKL